MARRALVAGCAVLAAAAVAHAEPAARLRLPAGGGRTGAGRACDSTDDCAPRSACVRSGAARGYVCAPLCAVDADCRDAPPPATACVAVADSAGAEYADRVCAEARATLATMLALRGSAPTGIAAWWEAAARVPEADVLRVRLALRVPVLRDLIRTRLAAAAQAAIAARLGSVNLVAIRYGSFTPSVDRVGLSRGAREDQVRVIVSGTITAARERLVVSFSGSSWEPDGTEDVAGYQAEVLGTVAIAPAPKLADQHVSLAVTPGPNSLTLHVSPLDGTVIANAFAFDPPPPIDVPLGAFAAGLPDRLQAAVVRWIRFGAIDDKELVVEAKAEPARY